MIAFYTIKLVYLLMSFVVIESAQPPRNVVFIMVDDLRPALGAYGDKNAVTPNIDKLAAKSFQFTEVYAQQSLCAPSRNSMLTGRRPDTLHLYDFYSYWRHTIGNLTTLPQYIKQYGYETISLGKIFHPGVSSNFTDDYPYSWSTYPYHSPAERYTNKPVCMDYENGSLQKNIFCPVTLKYQPLQTLPDIDTIFEAKKILHNIYRSNTTVADTVNNVKPLFLAIGLHKPHIPFKFPIKYLRYHQREKFFQPNFNNIPYNLPTVSFNPYTDVRERDDSYKQNISFPFGPVPFEFGVRLRQGYYSSVTYIDDLIGDLLNYINFNNTIIVLVGDHGWSLGEHAEWAKYSNYNVALRVPLIIYTPDFIPPTPCSATRTSRNTSSIHNIVELVDLFPTLIDLMGLPAISKCPSKNSVTITTTCTEGKSLFNLIKYPYVKYNKTYAFSQYPRPGPYPTMIPNSDKPKLNTIKIMGYSIRTAEFRYTIWIKFNNKDFTKNWNKIYGEELYDHRIDADENLNLANRIQFNDIKFNLKFMLKKQFK